MHYIGFCGLRNGLRFAKIVSLHTVFLPLPILAGGLTSSRIITPPEPLPLLNCVRKTRKTAKERERRKSRVKRKRPGKRHKRSYGTAGSQGETGAKNRNGSMAEGAR